jgi:hypothetical protein
MRIERWVLVGLAGVLAAAGLMLDTAAVPSYARYVAWVVAMLTFLFAVDRLFGAFRMCLDLG